MPVSEATWCYKQKGEWVEYAPDIREKIECAFSNFWSSGVGRPEVSWSGGDPSVQNTIDFRRFEQSQTAEDRSEERCVVCRQDPSIANFTDYPATLPQVQWGHAQDPMDRLGFAAFDADTNQLLEASFAMYNSGVGLKGCMFTAGNLCDYLVDFSSMYQTRLQTRRVRHVYRHSICRGMRMGVEVGAKSSEKIVAEVVAQLCTISNDQGDASTIASARSGASTSDSGVDSTLNSDGLVDSEAERRRIRSDTSQTSRDVQARAHAETRSSNLAPKVAVRSSLTSKFLAYLTGWASSCCS